MDLRARLSTVAPVSAHQFAFFRIVFGAYLTIHFAMLVPWGAELFSREGMLSDAGLNPTSGIFPNILARWDSPDAVTATLVLLTVGALLFTLGIARRPIALVLWYGWACLFNRNVLISNPSIAYVGLLLLLTALVPTTETWRLAKASVRREPFTMPAAVLACAWILLAAGYTFSGICKLSSPSWIDGTALAHVLNNPLARTGWVRDVLLALPDVVLHWATWISLAAEVLFLPLALWSKTRPFAWFALVMLHVGIMSVVSFADLSVGMLMVHVFTYDTRWLVDLRARLRRPGWLQGDLSEEADMRNQWANLSDEANR